MLRNRISQLQATAILTLLVATIAEAWPVPQWLAPWWPQWVVMVLMIWTLRHPHHLGYATAWGIGLLNDFVTGNLLGMHVISYSFIIFICSYYQRALSFSNGLWHIVPAAFLLIAHLLYTQMITLGALGTSLGTVLWESLPVSLLLWPPMYILLASIQRRSERSY